MVIAAPEKDYQFLSAGGEMGALMRAKDWSKTPVGDPVSWPQSLRTTLGILLNSNFPMFLWWGPSLTQFYNDAYRPSFGEKGKHPHALGQDGADCWPEIWPVIKPLIDQVLNGQGSPLQEDQLIPIFRNGELQDVYWTFSYSPVSDENGKVNGVLVVCNETTKKVSDMKRLARNEDQLKFTIDAADLGTWDLNPATNKFVGNERLKQWFGLLPEEEIDLSDALDAIIPDDRERVTDAIETALRPASGGIYEIEYNILNPRNGRLRAVLAKGKAIFGDDGTPLRFSGIMQDINERKNIEIALRKSEEKFRSTVSQAPIGITIIRGKDFIVEIANDTYLKLVDKQKQEFVGRSLFYSLPETETAVRPIFENIIKTLEPYYGVEFEIPLRRQSKIETTFFNFVYHPLKDAQDEYDGIIVIATEVTAQVIAQRELQESEKQFRHLIAQSPIAMGIFRGKDFIIELANDTLLKNIWRRELKEVQGKKLLDVFPELNDQKYPALLKKVFETGISHKETESEAYVNGPDGPKKFFLDYEYAALKNPDKTISGIIITVNDVTEKVEARSIIKDAADRLLLATEGTRLSTWDLILDKNGETLEYIHSPRLAEIFGHDRNVKLTHAQTRDQVHPDDRMKIVEKAFEEALTTGLYNYEARIILSNGDTRWIRTAGKVIFDEEKNPLRMLGTLLDITETRAVDEQLSLLAEIVRSSDDAIVSKRMDGTITSWNDAAQKMFGYTSEETVGRNITMLIPEDKIQEEAYIMNQLRQGKGIDHFETLRLTKDKRLIELSLSISPVKNSHGEVIGAAKIARDISKQNSYLRQLAEQGMQMDILMNAVDLGTWELNIITDAVTYTPGYLRIMGYTENDTPDHEELLSLFQPEDRVVRDRAFEEARKTGLLHYTSRVTWKDGSKHWIEVKGKTFYESGLPQKMIGTIRDITDEKLYQQRIEESESRLRIAALSGELGTWDFNPRTDTMIWDNASRDLFGVSPEEMITTELFFSRMHPDDVAPAIEKMKRAMDPLIAENYDAEYRVIGLPDDTLRWIHAKGKAQFDKNNVPVRFSGTVLDITEKKLALEELMENEQRYRFLADAMPQFVWTGGADGLLNYFNKAVYAYSGLTPEKMTFEGGWLQIVHPDDREENVVRWMQSVATGNPFLFEHRFRRHDGVYRWQLSRATAQKDENGVIQMWVGTSTDIDELKKHEQQKNDFIKMANHELKTPVTTIKGYVQLLLKTHGNNGDALLTNSLTTVDKQITKLTNLVSDLLDVTKIERGSLPLNKEVFAVSDLVRDTIRDMGAASQTHSIIFDSNVDAMVFADRDRISQVLINLFTNAFKYSPLADKIVVGIQKDDATIKVSVQDFGIGIAEEDQEKIFERFYRVSGKDEKTFPGFGIGLFIVKEIIFLHEGRLWVQSEKDKGATFYFSLPVHKK